MFHWDGFSSVRLSYIRSCYTAIQSGFFIFKLFQEEIDAGGIIAQEAVPVLPGDTEESLQERVKLKEWEVFPLAMELVAKGKVKEINGEAVFL